MYVSGLCHPTCGVPREHHMEVPDFAPHPTLVTKGRAHLGILWSYADNAKAQLYINLAKYYNHTKLGDVYY